MPRWQDHHEIAFWRSRKDGHLSETPPCEVLVLAVPDSAIADVARALSTRPSASRETWLHLSGVTPIASLRVSDTLPRAVGGLHPLVALAPGATLAGAIAGVEGEDPATLGLVEALARDLTLRPVALDHTAPHARALYHAAAVSVAGHATALFAQAMSMMQAAGFSPVLAREALQPLLLSAATNLGQAAPEAAITGPITRGDISTVEAHLDGLAKAHDHVAPHALETYRLLARTALDLSPGLAPPVRAALEALLSR